MSTNKGCNLPIGPGPEGLLDEETEVADKDGPSTCVATPEMLKLMDAVFLEDALQDGLAKYSANQIDSKAAFLEKMKQLNGFFELTDAFIIILKVLKTVIKLNNGIVLAAKTSGTTMATIGTVVGVTGLALAPFTLSSSLTVSAGAAASVGGAATNLITSWWDAWAKTKSIQVIQTLAREHQFYRANLNNTLDMIGDLVNSLMEMGLTANQALYAVLNEEFIAAPDDSTKNDHLRKALDGMEEDHETWVPLTKFCFSAGFHAFRTIEETKEIAEVAIAGGRGFFDMFRAGSKAAAETGSNGIASQVSRFLGSSVARNAIAVFGIVFTTMDIALLVQDWMTEDPTIEGIEKVIRRLEEDIDSTNIRKLWINVESLKQCSMVVGWIGNIPVVGTSPFAVEGLLSFYAGDFQKLRRLYGVAHYRVVDTISKQKLDVGFYSTEHLKSSIKEYRAVHGKSGQDDEQVPTEPKNGQAFLATLPEQDVIIGVPVFNPDVLRLSRDIIDSILQKGSYPSVEELREYLDTDFLQEYDTPLPSETVLLVTDSLVCSYKYGGHLNANKWEYNMAVDTLKDHASSYFSRHYKLGREFIRKELNSDDPDQKQFGGLTKCLVRHRSFTDRLAASIWVRDRPDEVKKYEAVCDELTKFIVLMDIKLPYWTHEIGFALDKYKYNNPDLLRS